jgi:hypothetical protein
MYDELVKELLQNILSIQEGELIDKLKSVSTDRNHGGIRTSMGAYGKPAIKLVRSTEREVSDDTMVILAIEVITVKKQCATGVIQHGPVSNLRVTITTQSVLKRAKQQIKEVEDLSIVSSYCVPTARVQVIFGSIVLNLYVVHVAQYGGQNRTRDIIIVINVHILPNKALISVNVLILT